MSVFFDLENPVLTSKIQTVIQIIDLATYLGLKTALYFFLEMSANDRLLNRQPGLLFQYFGGQGSIFEVKKN